MFGYISINKAEMKFKDYDIYHSFYCGLCQVLKKDHKRRGQMTLSYDMTFLLVLLSALYEPETSVSHRTCVAHPFEKHLTRINDYTSYVSDMNLLLAYHKCKDDWADEKKKMRYIYAKMLSPEVKKIAVRYPEKAASIARHLETISKLEGQQETDIDIISGIFGRIMAEVFTPKEDEWILTLQNIGFYLGKFIYLIDAYEDIERDMDIGTYNPLKQFYGQPDFEDHCRHMLILMMSECSRAFEKLPIIEYADILRNILYSGVWCRYETITTKRNQAQEKKHAGSI